VTRASDSFLEPPRWTQALLRFALPCDSTRDAILGDLYEEFTYDLADVGVRRARLRQVSRTTGIAARALFDSAICRGWVSAEPAEGVGRSPADVAAGGSPPVVIRHARTIVGAAGFPLLALFVVVIGVVINTMMFSAAQPDTSRGAPAAGIGGVALLLAFVALAAVILCLGPRWRRKRLRGA
jgi:hypothetical protein